MGDLAMLPRQLHHANASVGNLVPVRAPVPVPVQVQVQVLVLVQVLA